MLGAGEVVAEQDACRIEHIISAELLDRFEAFGEFVRLNPQIVCEFERFYEEKFSL